MCTSSSSGTRCSLRIYLSDTVVQGSEMQVCSSKVCVGEYRWRRMCGMEVWNGTPAAPAVHVAAHEFVQGTQVAWGARVTIRLIMQVTGVSLIHALGLITLTFTLTFTSN